MTPRRKGIIIGTANQWIDTLTHYYHDLRMDTFIFWPIGNEETQTHLFAEEVVPALRSALNRGVSS